MTLELRLLGRPRIIVDGHELTLPTRKSLGLLAYLSVVGPTSRSRLADLLWSDLDEPVARKNLRQELHRLSHSPVGAALLLSLHEVGLNTTISSDLPTFREHLAGGAWEAALHLYAGELLEGLEFKGARSFETWLEGERAQLNLAYQQALSQAAAAREAAGELRAALGWLQKLLEAEPFQEHLYRQMMRLSARLGERAVALEWYQKCREMLLREFALEPLPETAQLAERIGTGQAPVPVFIPLWTLPTLEPPLVGRRPEWSRLERAFMDGQMVYVAGEAGVGKSRLLREFGLSKGGYAVFQGAPADLNVPFATLTRGMRALLASYPVQLEPWERVELSRLMPELSQTSALPLQSEFGRLRLFDAYAAVYWRAVRDVPLVIADDLHWFDPASMELARYLQTRSATSGRRARLCITFRPDELSLPGRALLSEAIRLGQAQLIELGALSEDEVTALIGQLSASSPPPLARPIYETTGGNPFFVLETLKGLFESGWLRVDERGNWLNVGEDSGWQHRPLPIAPSVRAAVLARVERQPPPARRLLEVASLVGENFQLADVMGVTALGEWEAVDGLDQLQKAELIQAVGPGYSLSHDLVKRAVEDSLSPERRRLIYRRLLNSFEKASPARAAAVLLRYAVLADEPNSIERYALQVIEESRYLLVRDRDLDLVRQGADVLQRANHGQQATKLMAALAGAILHMGQTSRSTQPLEAALELMTHPEDEPRRASLRLDLSECYRAQGDYPRALEQANLALEFFQRAEQTSDLIHALLSTGEAQWWLRRFDQAWETYSQAQRWAISIGDSANAGWIYKNLGQTAFFQGHAQEAERLLWLSLRSAEDLPDKVNRAWISFDMARLQQALGKYPEAAGQARTALELFSAIGHRSGIPIATLQLAHLAALDGHEAEARRLFHDTAGAVLELAECDALFDFLSGYAALLERTGQAARAAEIAFGILAQARGNPFAHLEARRTLQQALTHLSPTDTESAHTRGLQLSFPQLLRELAGSFR